MPLLTLAANFAVTAGALLAEAALGYPDAAWRALRHPVAWIGALIGALDRRMNRATMPEVMRRLNGVLALLLVLGATALVTVPLQLLLPHLLPHAAALALLALLAATLPAQRSLGAHVAAVARALESEGVEAGRGAVGHIVGRDTAALDAAGVARAAIESLAENFSDGVAAPALWCALLGLPGIALYKAVNTADSMVGHRTPRHAAFGWASARLDDLVNLPASRLAALWIVAAALAHPGASALAALRAVLCDARHHRSPNAGWPEAAMAGALGLRLAGPRAYGGVRVPDAWMGDGRTGATAADIRRALGLYRIACAVQIAVLAGLALIAAG